MAGQDLVSPSQSYCAQWKEQRILSVVLPAPPPASPLPSFV